MFFTDTQRILLLESPHISLQHSVMPLLVVLHQEEQWMEILIPI